MAIQLVFCSCLRSLPMDANDEATMVLSMAAKKVPIATGGS